MMRTALLESASEALGMKFKPKTDTDSLAENSKREKGKLIAHAELLCIPCREDFELSTQMVSSVFAYIILGNNNLK